MLRQQLRNFRTRARQGLQTCFGGHGCLPAPTHPTQRLTGLNGGGIVGGSITEENGFMTSLSTLSQFRRQAKPRFFSLPFGPRAAKSGCGRQPAKCVRLPAASQTLCLPCRKATVHPPRPHSQHLLFSSKLLFHDINEQLGKARQVGVLPIHGR